MSQSDLKTQFAALLANPAIHEHLFFDLPSDQPPWFDSGLDVQQSDSFTSFANGKTSLKGTDLTFEAGFQLWFRIGEQGQIFRGTRDSHSFSPEQSGRLYLATCFPGEWSTTTGELATPPEVYAQATGNIEVLLIRWKTDALTALTQLAQSPSTPAMIHSEIDRLTHPVLPPDGWHYLWYAGPAEIYHDEHRHQDAAIGCHCHNDVGLLQKDIKLPFTSASRLRWAWKMDELPSKVREDTLPTHDYLSIAVEFSNGQDITYFWSSELPLETGFRCPIPTWTARETHVVIRTGLEDLGKWFNEERNLYEDYQRHIGGEMPESIVKVWLIAVALFQHGDGHCQYADIRFVHEGEEITVL